MARNPALLFYSNPPEDDALLRELFYNREAETERALDLLTADGLPNIPLSVHGPTRSGKSHFARYVVAEAVAKGAPFENVLVHASDRSTARRVLAAMYNRVLESIPQFPAGYTDGALESWQREFAEFHDVRPLVEDPKLAIDVEYTHTEAQARSNRFGFSFAPSVTFKAPVPTSEGHTVEPKVDLKVDVGHQRDQSQNDVRKVKGQLSLPTDDHVVAWILRLLEFRRRLHPKRRVLFLVDDLDLLDPERENSEACSVLVEKLSQLAKTGACVVVVTVRSEANNGRSKDLRSLVEIGTWGSPEHLLAVYQKRVELLNDGEAVFAPDALEWLAKQVEGSVGMFLQYCDEVSAKVPRAKRPITLDALRQRLREQFAEWRSGHAELVFILARVEEAVLGGRLQVEFEAELPHNLLLHRLITKLSGRKATYAISPLYLHTLRRT